MCGRFRCTLRADDIPRACHLNGRPLRHVNMDRYRPSYNVSPRFNLPVIRRDDCPGSEQGDVVLYCMKWGLIPSFTKKTEKPDHYKMFNARSESIREKASFRRLIPANRCLVAVEGFYEWKKDGSKKQPYYIHFKDGRPLVFAALFDSWKNSEGEVLYSFTILTTSSSSALGWLHDRMPVILGNKETTKMWLDGSSSDIDTLLKPYGESDLAWYPVTPAIGKPSFDGPECIKEIQLKTSESRSISQFFSKNGAESRVESKLPRGTTIEESAKINQQKNLKEETETQDSIKNQLAINTDDDDIKPDFSELSCEKTIDDPVKREYEESRGTLHSDDEADKSHVSPSKKKHRGTSGETIAAQKEEAKKPSANKSAKLSSSSVRRKATGAGDKQPTLFSYFGKG